MKKTLSFIAAFAFTAVLMTSCSDKCTTCTYTYDVNGTEESATFPQVCGSKSEVNTYKDGVQATAELQATALGGTNVQTSCVDD